MKLKGYGLWMVSNYSRPNRPSRFRTTFFGTESFRERRDSQTVYLITYWKQGVDGYSAEQRIVNSFEEAEEQKVYAASDDEILAIEVEAIKTEE